MVESPFLGVFKVLWMWHLGTWFSGGLNSVKLMVGLNDINSLFQSKWFHNSTFGTRRLQHPYFKHQAKEKAYGRNLLKKKISFPDFGISVYSREF